MRDDRSCAAAALAGRDAAGDQVGDSKGLRNISVEGRSRDDPSGLLDGEAGSLDPKLRPCCLQAGGLGSFEGAATWTELLEGAGLFDELPLSLRARHARPARRRIAEEGTMDRGHVGWAADHDEDRDLKSLREGVDVDDVEATHRDTLHHDGLNMLAELARSYELHHLPGGVGPVSSDAPADDAVDPRRRANDADEEHVAAMISWKRSVVEADDIHGGLAGRIAHLLMRFAKNLAGSAQCQ